MNKKTKDQVNFPGLFYILLYKILTIWDFQTSKQKTLKNTFR